MGKTSLMVNGVDYTTLDAKQKDAMVHSFVHAMAHSTGIAEKLIKVLLAPGSVKVDVSIDTTGHTPPSDIGQVTVEAFVAELINEKQDEINKDALEKVKKIEGLKTTGKLGVKTTDIYLVAPDGAVVVVDGATSAPTKAP